MTPTGRLRPVTAILRRRQRERPLLSALKSLAWSRTPAIHRAVFGQQQSRDLLPSETVADLDELGLIQDRIGVTVRSD